MSTTRLTFSAHGQFDLAGRTIHWKETERGDIVLKEGNDANFHSFSDFIAPLKTSVAQSGRPIDVQLNIVNKLLAHYRPHAIPDDNGYYAAAAGVCEDGRLFVAVNNEKVIKDGFEGRGCAETKVLARCIEATGNPNVQIKPLYLTSGRARLLPSGALRDDMPGSWSCLCGECRKNERAHTLGGEFIMIPTNDGSKILVQAEAGDASELKPNQAWRIPYNQLYPTPEYRTLSADDSELVIDGYDAITDRAHNIPKLDTDLPANAKDLTPEQYERLRSGYEQPDTTIPALNDNPSFTNINRTMLHLIKQAYWHHAVREHVPNMEITAVIVKTDKGEFYPSVLVNGDLWLPSKPHEIPVALTNAYNQRGYGEIYMMTFDNYQLQNERTDKSQGVEVSHKVKNPDPKGLGRLIKNMKQDQTASMHVIPINDGTLSEEVLHRISGSALDVRVAFGPEFTNPKRSVAAGRG